MRTGSIRVARVSRWLARSRIGSGATGAREPSQVRKEAALSGPPGCRRVAWSAPDPTRRERRRRHGARSARTGAGSVGPWRPACTASTGRSASRSWSARSTSPPRCATRSARTASVTRTSSPGRGAPARPRPRGILATALNCLDLGADGEPCGKCENCVAIAAGTFFDLVELDAASNNGVEAMRDLIQSVHLGLGATSRRKVYIVDEVHMLSAAASNTLLKTLEEPPAHVVFVLATTDPAEGAADDPVAHAALRVHAALARASSSATSPTSSAGRASRPTPRRSTSSPAGPRGSARDALSLLDQALAVGGGRARRRRRCRPRSAARRSSSALAVLEAVAAEDVAGALVGVHELLDAGPRRRAASPTTCCARCATRSCRPNAAGRVPYDGPAEEAAQLAELARGDGQRRARARDRDPRPGDRRHSRAGRRRSAPRARGRGRAARAPRSAHARGDAARPRRAARAAARGRRRPARGAAAGAAAPAPARARAAPDAAARTGAADARARARRRRSAARAASPSRGRRARPTPNRAAGADAADRVVRPRRRDRGVAGGARSAEGAGARRDPGGAADRRRGRRRSCSACPGKRFDAINGRFRSEADDDQGRVRGAARLRSRGSCCAPHDFDAPDALRPVDAAPSRGRRRRRPPPDEPTTSRSTSTSSPTRPTRRRPIPSARLVAEPRRARSSKSARAS